ncbi:hypothetical protein Tco_0197557, partial [Tanacetum coccineum]
IIFRCNMSKMGVLRRTLHCIKPGVQEKKSGKRTRVNQCTKGKDLQDNWHKSTEGSKSHQKSVDESAKAKEPMQTTKDLKEPAHQEFKIGVTKDQTDEETSKLPDWF